MKRFISMVLLVVIITSALKITYADDFLIKDYKDNVVSDAALELLSINSVLNEKNPYLISYVPEGTKTGEIYFDKSCGTIMGCSTDFSIEDFVIPESIENITVKEIGENAFSNSRDDYGYERNIHIAKLHIPSTVKKIGSRAFYSVGCYQIDIEEGVEYIDTGAFGNNYGVNMLKGDAKLIIPSSVKYIGEYAFGQFGVCQVVYSEGLIFIQKTSPFESITLLCRDAYIAPSAFWGGEVIAVLPDSEYASEIGEGYGIRTIYCFKNSTADNLNLYRRESERGIKYYKTNIKYLDDDKPIVGDDEDENIKSGTFIYATEKNNFMSTYYYNDAYFKHPGWDYDSSLATMSLCLAMSAFGHGGYSEDYTNKSQNVKDLLVGQLKFNNFSTNDYLVGGFDNIYKPTNHSIGVACANKHISEGDKDYTLLVVAVRGSNYEREWASNFTIGEDGQADGFEEAKNNVLEFLKGYIEENNINGDIKLWITGYSRAAATSNLVAGAIADGENLGDNINLDEKDLYAYCFETPMGAEKSANPRDSKYNNIFNIINPNDPVPKVAMSGWGFDRYGIDKYIPTETTSENYKELKSKMLDQLHQLLDFDVYTVDNFENKKISIQGNLKNLLAKRKLVDIAIADKKNRLPQSVFLDEFLSILTDEYVLNRYGYTNRLQDSITYVLDIYFGTTPDEKEKINEYFSERYDSVLLDVIIDVFSVGTDRYNKIINDLSGHLETCLNISNVKYDKDKLKKATNDIVDLIVPIVIDHPNYSITLGTNIDSIGSAHYPNLCFAWMRAMDENYTSNPIKLTGGKYRVVKVNCPVDVEVFDTDGSTIAEINNDNPQDIEDSSIISAINYNGEKVIYLPADKEYDIKLSATDNGTMNYAINEYNSSTGNYSRIINYYNIDIEKDEILTANVPAYSLSELEDNFNKGTSVEYLLEKHGNVLEPNIDIKDAEIQSKKYNVKAIPNNEKFGMIWGQGSKNIGDFAQLEAVPNEGYKFDGWYINDNLVSTDERYRFCVTENVEIIGQFTETTTNTDSSTETTTIPHSSGGGGGSSRKVSITTTTATTTTEDTTEITTIETTEVTTQSAINSDVKVTIGKSSVEIGNNTYAIDAAAYIQTSSNSTMVPLRFVAIAILGADVENADNSNIISWDANTKTATITVNKKKIEFTAGSDKMVINGMPTTMEYGVSAEIKDGRMYIPFRALGSALGVDVSWIADTKTAVYKTK